MKFLFGRIFYDRKSRKVLWFLYLKKQKSKCYFFFLPCQPVLQACSLNVREREKWKRGTLLLSAPRQPLHSQRPLAGPCDWALGDVPSVLCLEGFLRLLLPLQGPVLLCHCLGPFHRQKIRMNLALEKAVKMLRDASWPSGTVQ